ncbi:hypothetical protein CPter91_1911 [Collimonas pratensis]|uniref:Uncharacterized protein n=1 Tax=Collimonas pratensis TaxID=279113 RepID=A0A127Q2M0_9BURK|nr:hypothetical protein CPter91_1911 [Collimonas pratensis]
MTPRADRDPQLWYIHSIVSGLYLVNYIQIGQRDLRPLVRQ